MGARYHPRLGIVPLENDRTGARIDNLGVQQLHLGLRVYACILVVGGYGQVRQLAARNRRAPCTTDPRSPNVDRVFS